MGLSPKYSNPLSLSPVRSTRAHATNQKPGASRTTPPSSTANCSWSNPLFQKVLMMMPFSNLWRKSPIHTICRVCSGLLLLSWRMAEQNRKMKTFKNWTSKEIKTLLQKSKMPLKSQSTSSIRSCQRFIKFSCMTNRKEINVNKEFSRRTSQMRCRKFSPHATSSWEKSKYSIVISSSFWIWPKSSTGKCRTTTKRCTSPNRTNSYKNSLITKKWSTKNSWVNSIKTRVPT